MAGIDNLKNRLIKDSQAEADAIFKESKEKAERIIEDGKVKSKKLIEDSRFKAEKEAASEYERIITKARLDSRNEMITARQEAIDNIFDKAKDYIVSMDSADYTNFIEKLILNNIDMGNEEIIFSESDLKKLDKELLDRVNKKLCEQGKTGDIKISSEKRNIGPGFILKNGRIEINCTIELQLKLLRENIEGEIASIIFEDI